jgi:hypothetical protein
VSRNEEEQKDKIDSLAAVLVNNGWFTHATLAIIVMPVVLAPRKESKNSVHLFQTTNSKRQEPRLTYLITVTKGTDPSQAHKWEGSSHSYKCCASYQGIYLAIATVLSLPSILTGRTSSGAGGSGTNVAFQLPCNMWWYLTCS